MRTKEEYNAAIIIIKRRISTIVDGKVRDILRTQTTEGSTDRCKELKDLELMLRLVQARKEEVSCDIRLCT